MSQKYVRDPQRDCDNRVTSAGESGSSHRHAIQHEPCAMDVNARNDAAGGGERRLISAAGGCAVALWC